MFFIILMVKNRLKNEVTENQRISQRKSCKLWRMRNPEKNRKLQEEWRQKHPDYAKQWKLRNSEKMKRYHQKLRFEVLIHYGGDPPKCACCGESHIEFLTIDHIYGGGNKERKKLGRNGGHAFYVWLRKNNFPEGYRVLCLNCNFSLGHSGYCPHQGVKNEQKPKKE